MIENFLKQQNTHISTRLQSYFLFTNTLISILLVFLSASLYNVNFSSTLNSNKLTQCFIIVTIVIFSCISLATILLSLKHIFRIRPVFNTEKYLQIQSITQYLLSLPLSYMAFYFFARIHHLKTMPVSNYFILLACPFRSRRDR